MTAESKGIDVVGLALSVIFFNRDNNTYVHGVRPITCSFYVSENIHRNPELRLFK